MSDPALIAQGLVLVASMPAMAAFGVRFYRRQNSGALGGAMSKAKAYWLSFAIWFWFILCPVVAVGDVVAQPLRLVLGAFALSMWIRGVAEMVMLYVTKSWRPPLGIGHDVLSILLVVALLVARGGEIGRLVDGVPVADAAAILPSIDAWALALCATVLVSLVVEIHHARSFHHAVQGRTTGDDGVWFADEEQEHFKQINRNTFFWNIVLSCAVLAFVVRYLGLVLSVVVTSAPNGSAP